MLWRIVRTGEKAGGWLGRMRRRNGRSAPDDPGQGDGVLRADLDADAAAATGLGIDRISLLAAMEKQLGAAEQRQAAARLAGHLVERQDAVRTCDDAGALCLAPLRVDLRLN